MFVDMAANQTRLGSATSAWLLLHIRELFLPMERRIPDHWNPFEVMIVFEMFGQISNTRWGGAEGGFSTFSTYERYETSWHEVCFVALLM